MENWIRSATTKSLSNYLMLTDKITKNVIETRGKQVLFNFILDIIQNCKPIWLCQKYLYLLISQIDYIVV